MAKKKAVRKAKKTALKRQTPHAPGGKHYKANLKFIERMTLLHLTHAKMAAILGIGLDTLKKHYALELTLGKARIGAECVQRLLQIARGKDDKLALAACCWILGRRYGFNESTELEVSQRLTGAIIVPADKDLDTWLAHQEARNETLTMPGPEDGDD